MQLLAVRDVPRWHIYDAYWCRIILSGEFWSSSNFHNRAMMRAFGRWVGSYRFMETRRGTESAGSIFLFSIDAGTVRGRGDVCVWALTLSKNLSLGLSLDLAHCPYLCQSRLWLYNKCMHMREPRLEWPEHPHQPVWRFACSLGQYGSFTIKKAMVVGLCHLRWPGTDPIVIFF